jgi:hypothetical protein
MPVAPNTSSSMIVRTANPNAVYTIYNLGLNQILLGQDIISGIGDNWNFAVDQPSPVSGRGVVNWDFAGNTLDLWVKRPTTMVINGQSVAVNQFLVYNIAGNQVTSNSGILGNIGQDWQLQGFGYFFRSDFGQADMLTRNVSNSTATYLAYDTESNQFINVIVAAKVGANFSTAGLGTYVTPDNSAQLMVLQDSGKDTGTPPSGMMVEYAYNNGMLVNSGTFANIGNGKDWEVLGFGQFSSFQFGLNMIIRNIDPTSANFQQIWIYDVIQTPTGNYAAQLSTAVTPGQKPGVLGPVGLDWKVAGIGPVSGGLGPITDDLVMRNTSTGAFQVYNIQNDTLTGSAPLTPPSSKPIASTSTVGGMAIDLSPPPPSGSTSQLVQAMAGFGGSSGAAGGLSTAPLGADTSQQQQSFLTTPQHA